MHSRISLGRGAFLIRYGKKHKFLNEKVRKSVGYRLTTPTRLLVASLIEALGRTPPQFRRLEIRADETYLLELWAAGWPSPLREGILRRRHIPLPQKDQTTAGRQLLKERDHVTLKFNDSNFREGTKKAMEAAKEAVTADYRFESPRRWVPEYLARREQELSGLKQLSFL